MNKCRCDERLQTKTKEFTRLPYTGLVLELEHLKIETTILTLGFRLFFILLNLLTVLSLDLPVPRPTSMCEARKLGT
jgi:hypothetical protein